MPRNHPDFIFYLKFSLMSLAFKKSNWIKYSNNTNLSFLIGSFFTALYSKKTHLAGLYPFLGPQPVKKNPPSKRRPSIVRVFIFLFFLGNWSVLFSQSIQTQWSQSAVLKRGTPVLLRVIDNIYSTEVEAGYPVRMEVLVNVNVDQQVVAFSGAFAEGQIIALKKSGFFGQGAKITLGATSMQAVDGQRIPLQTNPLFIKNGRNRRSIAIGFSVLIPISGVIIGTPFTLPFVLFGFLVKGKPAIIQIGTEISAQVSQDVEITLNKP